MSAETLDALLDRMPKIAECVNKFNSETVQQEAFVALIAAFQGNSPLRSGPTISTPAPEKPNVENGSEVSEAPTPSGSSGASTRKRKKNASGRVEWTVVKGLDLHPSGKVSFEQFIAEKQPRSNEDRYAVVVYYLELISELPAVTINDVGTVFRMTPGWQEPTALRTGLTTASSRKSTIDCSNMEAIKTTPQGRNFVEHKLPVKANAK